MFLFLVTRCLVVAVQPCMEWIPVKKSLINSISFNCQKICSQTKRPRTRLTLLQNYQRNKCGPDILKGSRAVRGWPRGDLRLIYRFWEYLIWTPKFKIGRKRKTNVLNKNRKLPSVTLFCKSNIKSEYINIVNRTKNCHIGFIVILSQ